MGGHEHHSNVGHTLFKPTGVHHEFICVDLLKQQVTGIVIYNEKIYMTVMIDVKNETAEVQGDVAELGELGMEKASYIELFQHQAKFFIENNIANPQEYYDGLIKNQP